MRSILTAGLACAVLTLLASCGEEAERAPEVPAAAEAGFQPDSLAWIREGRPVEFGGRLWQPVGEPIEEPASSFRVVGEFEGMTLLAARGEDEPYAHLFFPYGSDSWQTLQPVEAEAAGAGGQ